MAETFLNDERSDYFSNIISLVPERRLTFSVLIVDDDKMVRTALENEVMKLGFDYKSASNGLEAFKILEQSPDSFDIVLLDRMMPIMDGLTMVRHMKASPLMRHIPVVMLTADSQYEHMREGLKAGVFYYLPKPTSAPVLESVLMAAKNEVEHRQTLREELKKHRASFDLIQQCKFEFRTLQEAVCLAAFMASCFPDPERVMTGLAQLMINAVEHGNLEIGYDKKTQLLADNIWRAEIDKRLQMDEHKNKKVEAILARQDNGLVVTITDQGAGFDWRDYIQVDPGRVGDNHGRSIAQAAALSFDKLTYNEKGNKAVIFVGDNPPLEW